MNGPVVDEPAPPRWQQDWVAVLALCVLTLALWAIRRHGPAWAMEEAMMLQAPSRVLDGAIPGKDFDYFYGPLSLVIPAGTYWIASPSLVVERFIGAVYVAIVGVGLYFVGRRWTFTIGIAMATIGVLIGALSMTALPIMGAIGGLVAMVAVATSGLSPTRRAIMTGLAASFAVGMRPEFALFAIVLLGAFTVLRRVRPVAWAAAAFGLAPYLWLVFGAGLGATWRNLVTDALHVGSERHLPFRAHLGGPGLLVIIGAVTSVVAVVIGFVKRRESTGAALVGLGILGVCLIPEYVQRADTVHAIYVTMVPLATIVPVTYESFSQISLFRTRPPLRQLVAVAVAALVLLGLRPKFVARATLRDARSALIGRPVYVATNQGATWYFADAAVAKNHAILVDAARRIARPGDTLFVGPTELMRPTYTDGSFYTLLPEYTQHTHFYDFHPRIAQVDGARLAKDVAAADVVILCDVGFDEDNRSKHRGSHEANDVIIQRFELVEAAGGCRVYRHIGTDGDRQ